MSQDSKEKLKMTFDPNTIQHLGIRMYSNLPAALAELVANAYDADSTEVHIKLYDCDEMKRIIVSDNGIGMSFSEINDYFLKIGRNRRSENLKQTLGGRVASGKKGLGKLALFGIGERIDVTTKKNIENRTTHFILQWSTLKNWNKLTQGPDYEPTFDFIDQNDNKQGTEICISDLKRKTDFSSINDLAANLAKMFNFLDKNFKIYISRNDQPSIEITNKLKYESLDIQFTWNFPSTSIRTVSEYEEKANLSGKIITTKTPLRAGQRGVTLFANGRMVNNLEFFGVSESSHFFSYTTGWLNVDFIDEDNGEDDNISTNRQSLDWEKEKSIKLKNFLQVILSLIQKEWRERRKEENKKDAESLTGINIEKWLSTIPADKADIITKAIEDVSNPDFKSNYTEIIERALFQIAPHYAELHWRYLHEKITSNKEINRLYVQKNYFQAASECAKLYIEEVRSLSKSTNSSDSSMMGEVFGRESNKIISLTERKDEIDGDVEEGQKYYSMGIVTGFKNPVCSHATETSLKSRGLFNEKDCLDIFSLLSHLFYRLDNVKIK